MNLLFLSRWFPYPPDNGSKIRIYNLLRGLSRHHRVSLISFYQPSEPAPDIGALRSVCDDIQLVPWKAYHPDSWRSIKGFLSATPRAYVDTYSAEMASRIRQKLNSDRVDLVIASEIDTALYAPVFEGTPAIFEDVEVGVPYDQAFLAASFMKRLRARLTWFKHRRFLETLLEYFRAYTVVSAHEGELINNYVKNISLFEVIPNCVDIETYKAVNGNPSPNRIIFIGSLTYQPNYEGIVWFLREVFPRIREELPEVHLTITGNHADLPLPHAQNVTRTGMVENVYPYIADSWLSIVPLHTGGGTRLKILESMALNTPVVTTSKGAEGLDVVSGQHALVADEPVEFAREIIRIICDPDTREYVAQQGNALVHEKYNWGIVMQKYDALIEKILGESP